MGFGRAGNRVRKKFSIADDPDAAFALGDEHVAVWKEEHVPGKGQPLGDRGELESILANQHAGPSVIGA